MHMRAYFWTILLTASYMRWFQEQMKDSNYILSQTLSPNSSTQGEGAEMVMSLHLRIMELVEV